MCGIIGYIGSRDAQKVLLKGLENIQYRGYDSMGFVVSTPTGFKRVRSVGDITELKKNIVAGENYSSSCGLGHSRWATHGVPSKKNAHPHKSQSIYIVHNGIIENAEELQSQFDEPCVSDTDSEVVAHCIAHFYKKTKCLKKAVFATIPKLKGEYAIAVMSEDSPQEILAFKKGPSLVIGVGEQELFVSSDAQVFLPYTKKIIFLNNGEVVHFKNQKMVFYSAQQKEIKKQITVLDSHQKNTSKQGYKYYMLKEIHEQPLSVERIINTHINTKKLTVELQFKNGSGILDQIIKAGRFNIAASGSSYYAALYGKYIIENFSRICVEVDIASEFRYRSPILSPKIPILLVSQSGETADVLAVMRMVQKFSVPVFSLCNVAYSSLDRGSLAKLYMDVGVERGVASTKSFVVTLVSFLLLALQLAKKKGVLSASTETNIVKELLLLPSFMKEVLSEEQKYKKVARIMTNLKSFIYLGRDIYYPLALEGALKMKELTYISSEAYPAGEMKHGPLALVDKNMAVVALVPKSHVYQKTLINLEEVRSRGGNLILIGTKNDKNIKSLTDNFLSIPMTNQYIASVLSVLPMQLMAYYTACFLGHNIDQPRNLAKSVTVE